MSFTQYYRIAINTVYNNYRGLNISEELSIQNIELSFICESLPSLVGRVQAMTHRH